MVQKPSLEPRLGHFFSQPWKNRWLRKELCGRPGFEATKNLCWLFHSSTLNPLLRSKTCRNPQNTDFHNPDFQKKLCHHPLPPDKTEPCFMKFNLHFSLTWQHQISSKMCRVCHFLVTISDRGSNQGLPYSPPAFVSLSLGTGLLLSSLPPSLPSLHAHQLQCPEVKVHPPSEITWWVMLW